MNYSRHEPRVAIEWAVILSGYDFEAQGVVKEISCADLRLVNSTWQMHPVGSAPLTAILNELETQRHGAVFSVRYTF